MSAQPGLFATQARRVETPAARSSDPETSHEAADFIHATGIRQTRVERVTAAIRMYPDRTALEIAALSGMDRHYVGKGTSECETAGTAIRMPKRKCSISKRSAETWSPK